MTEQEMRKRVERYIDEAFAPGIDTAEEAKGFLARFDSFCKENRVPFEIRELFTQSGAGEMLYMMQGIGYRG